MENGEKKRWILGLAQKMTLHFCPWHLLFKHQYLWTEVLSVTTFKSIIHKFLHFLCFLAWMTSQHLMQGVAKNFFLQTTSEGWDLLTREKEHRLEAKSNNRKMKWSITLQKKKRKLHKSFLTEFAPEQIITARHAIFSCAHLTAKRNENRPH